MKECTKCFNQLSDEQIFCPYCGTKQYISMQDDGVDAEAVYVKITRCRWNRGLLNTNCQLNITGSQLTLTDSSFQTLLAVNLSDIVEVTDFQPKIGAPKSKGINITVKPNKSHHVFLPADMADFIPYLKSLILDCRDAGIES